jgi:DNA-binding response OmpR family regulator
MPGLNGAEVLERLRADEDPGVAQLPAIMLTGHGGEASEVLCLEAGADDFVTKPINQAVLRGRASRRSCGSAPCAPAAAAERRVEAWRRISSAISRPRGSRSNH